MSDIYKYKTDNSILKFLFVINGIILICIILLVIYKLYIENRGNVQYKSEALMSYIGLVIIYVILSCIILPRWYRSLEYYVSSEEIIIQSGVALRRKVVLRNSAINVITLLRIPVFYRVNMNFMLIDAHCKRVIIKFLRLQDMEEILGVVQPSYKFFGGGKYISGKHDSIKRK